MKPKRKIISLLLCAAMLLSLCPTSVFAEAAAQDSGIAIGASGLCEHHTEHNEGCGYTEGTPETPCNHEHTEDCYTLVTECIHEHTDECYPQETVSGNVATPPEAGEREPENCAHVCSEESGCITKSDCQHEHDRECGYAPATEGTLCGFVCKICATASNSLISPLANEETYNINDKPVTIDDSCADPCPGHKITGNGQTSNTIEVTGGTHNITIENVNISAGDYNSAFSIANGATVNLTLSGTNTLKGAYMRAGLHVPNGATLTITGADSDTLNATGGAGGAGIGGGYGSSGGIITIKGGTVNANGGNYGAGIGGGDGGSGGIIIINGGTVTATGGTWGAGIGGGDDGSGGTITISGGDVMVRGGQDSVVDIGNGNDGDPSEKIEISDNATVTRKDGGQLNIGASHGVDNSKWRHDGTYHWHPCKIESCNDTNHQFNKATYTLTIDDTTCLTEAICSICKTEITAAQTDHSFNNYVYQHDASYFNEGTETATCDNTGCTQTDTRAASGHKPTDTTAPAGTIKIGENEWKALLNTLTFGLFFKDTRDVTITTEDDSYEQEGYDESQAVKVGYYLDENSDTPLDKQALDSMTFTEYNGKLSIKPDNKLVVYVKLTDWAGNVTYISSEGIVLDSTPPEISGIENNKTYCEAVEITVTDDYLKEVTVDGTPQVPAADGKLTISPKTGEQVIVATDEADNKTTYTITVNNGHTYTAINDCTKEEKCTVCNEVIKAAKDHVPQDDDGDCLTPVKCKNCDVITTAAKPHEPENDDGNCLTPVKCKNCDVITTAAKTAHNFTKEDASEKYLKSAATCKAQAVYYKSCVNCVTSSEGTASEATFTSGNVDPDNHINTEVQNQKDPTATEKGYTGDLYCKDCGKLLEKGSVVPATECIITFDGNGGTSPAPQTTTGKKLTSLPASDQSGYSFNGWYTAKTGGDKITLDTVFSASMTVYAQWTKNSSGGGDTTPDYYMLTFETNGGSKIDRIKKTSGTRIDLTEYQPTREGYDFNGWYADKALTEKITSIRLNGNKTVYAGWTKQAVPVDPADPDKENPSTGGSPFTDVKESDWFYEAVMFVYEKEIMVGTSDTTFSPYGTATRGMMAAIIWRMEGSPKAEYSGTLKDVPNDSYYAEAIKWTMQQGIFNGYGGGLFGPDDPITRQQLAAIFYNYAKYKGYDLTPTDSLSGFTDGDKVSDWAQDAMKWAVGSGLMNGKGDGILDPQGTATRAEIAAMLHRFIEKYRLVEGVAPGGMTGWIDPRRTLSPQTGDNTNITLWAGMFLFSAMALAVTLYTIRRRDNDETPFPT